MTQKQTSTRAGTRRSTPAPKFSAKVESIGPDKAKKYLALMPRNRRKRKRHKDRLTNSMNSGHWKLTGESIKFNTKGELIDGQHRLEAIIESGKTVDILVCRNVPDDAFMELDTGAARTPGDLLTVAGYDYTNGVASCIRNIISLYEIEGGQVSPSSLSRKRVEPEELLEFAAEHNEFLKEAVRLTMTKQARTVLGPPAMFAGLYFIFAEHNKKAADEFFEILIEGIGYEQGKIDPVYQLHTQLRQFKQEKHKRRPSFYKAAITIKAWNAFQNRETIKSLRYSENETWPEINRRKVRVTEAHAAKRAEKKARLAAKKTTKKKAAAKKTTSSKKKAAKKTQPIRRRGGSKKTSSKRR